MDDKFIPIRAGELASALAEDAERFGMQPTELCAVAAFIETAIEARAAAVERRVADQYASFNPDRDTRPLADIASTRTRQNYEQLKDGLSQLLTKANFHRLEGVEVERVIRKATSRGLRVRLNAQRIQYVHVWVRGRGRVSVWRPAWRHPIRGITRDVNCFRRLAVIAQLRDDPHVLLKLFKDIPDSDVEALLPHAETEMTLSDRLLLVGGGAGTIAPTLVKAFNLVAAALTKLLWTIALAAGTLLFRSVIGYRRARKHRDSQRTQHLYFQNLCNNAAVIHTLSSLVAQEDIKEALLAYVFCLHSPCANAAELASRVQAYLKERFDVDFSFDATDAIESLAALGLWQDRAVLRPARFTSDGRVVALPSIGTLQSPPESDVRLQIN